MDAVAPDASGRARVDISATVSDDLLDQIRALGGSVLFASAQDRSILAILPLNSLERLGGQSECGPGRTGRAGHDQRGRANLPGLY